MERFAISNSKFSKAVKVIRGNREMGAACWGTSLS